MIDISLMMINGEYIPWLLEAGGTRVIATPFRQFAESEDQTPTVYVNKQAGPPSLTAGAIAGPLKLLSGRLVQEFKLANRNTRIHLGVRAYTEPFPSAKIPMYRARIVGLSRDRWGDIGILLDVVKADGSVLKLGVAGGFSVKLSTKVRQAMAALGCREDDTLTRQFETYTASHKESTLCEEMFRRNLWIDDVRPGGTYTSIVGYRHRCKLVSVMSREEWDAGKLDIGKFGEKDLTWDKLKQATGEIPADRRYMLLYRLSVVPFEGSGGEGWDTWQRT